MKMFNTLWTEPLVGEDPPTLYNSKFTRIMFDEFAYHTLRNFVVVEERQKQGFSYCWQGIAVYDNDRRLLIFS